MTDIPRWLQEAFDKEQGGKTYPVAGAGISFYTGPGGQTYRVVRDSAYTKPVCERWPHPVPDR